MPMKTNVTGNRNPELEMRSDSAARNANGLRVSVLGFVVAWLVVFAAGCGKGSEPRVAAPNLPTAAVRVQNVESKKYRATEEVVGTVRAKLRATLEAKVSGRIEKMPVVAGQSVKAGDVIAQLDVGEIRAKLDQASAMREQAARELQRFENLLRDKAVTPQEFDGVQARWRVADAGVTEAQTMLGYATVTAPFDGVITRKLADVGDLASPGRPLVDLEDPAALRLEADVPEAIIGGVQSGAPLPVHVAGAASVLDGVVSEVAPVADPNSRTFRVKLDLPAAAGLRVGQFGRVAVPVGETTLPRVPESAVVQRGQMEMVFVVVGQNAQLRLVKTGRRIGGEVELLSGVSAGDPVVVEGAAGLVDGQPVTSQ